MPWAHCEHAALPDTAACPTCGTTKAAWTLTVDATRTFVVGRKARPRRAKDAWLEVALPGAPGAACALELADGHVVEAQLDARGVLRQEGLYPGECRVRFPGRAARPAWDGAPAADDAGWVACATGASHRFELLAGGPALRIVWPGAAEHVQWVNLRPDGADPSRGNRLTLRVAAPAGTTVHAALRPQPGNSARSAPAPGLVGPSARVVPAAGEVTFEVELGCAGKDRFELATGDTGDCAGPRVLVETRRRIFLQLARTREQPVPALDLAVAAFAEVGIELVRVPDVLLAPPGAAAGPGEPRTKEAPAGCWLPASDVASEAGRPPGPRLVVGNHDALALRGLFDPMPAPGIKALVVDDLLDGHGPDGRPIVARLDFELAAPGQWHSAEIPADAKLLSRSLADGGPAVREGRWRSLAPAGHPDHGAGGEVRQEDLRLRWRKGLQLTPRRADGTPFDRVGDGAGPPTAPATRHPVRVELTLHIALGEKSGRALRDLALIVHRADPARLQATLVHELGHGLRQAGLSKRVPPGLAYEAHGRFAINRYDQAGAHCADGLTDAQFARNQLDGLAPTCVMWGAIAETSEGGAGFRFCDRCAPYVRADHCRDLAGWDGQDDPPAW